MGHISKIKLKNDRNDVFSFKFGRTYSNYSSIKTLKDTTPTVIPIPAKISDDDLEVIGLGTSEKGRIVFDGQGTGSLELSNLIIENSYVSFRDITLKVTNPVKILRNSYVAFEGTVTLDCTLDISMSEVQLVLCKLQGGTIHARDFSLVEKDVTSTFNTVIDEQNSILRGFK